MPLYETTFVIRQDLSKQDVQKLTDQYSAIIAEQGGKVTNNEYWGLRNLAYKINKNRKAHYVMLSIDAPAEAVKEMERNMRINEEVIRMLTVRVEALLTEPSAMLSTRSERSDSYGDAEASADSDAA